MRSWTRGYYRQGECVALGSVLDMGGSAEDAPQLGYIAGLYVVSVFRPRDPQSTKAERVQGSPDDALAQADRIALEMVGATEPNDWVEAHAPATVTVAKKA